jgi:hypothetical protein
VVPSDWLNECITGAAGTACPFMGMVNKMEIIAKNIT